LGEYAHWYCSDFGVKDLNGEPDNREGREEGEKENYTPVLQMIVNL